MLRPSAPVFPPSSCAGAGPEMIADTGIAAKYAACGVGTRARGRVVVIAHRRHCPNPESSRRADPGVPHTAFGVSP
ncbi:hypothetical protein [Lysobacter gummosus]|uniref:hypothetical protein n=1 Tax=Lysobacter gummosus TaxID=262324 RepID=UPI003633B304